MVRHFLAASLAFLAVPAAAAEWTVEPVPVDGAVVAVRQDGPDVYVQGSGWMRLVLCEESRVCLEEGEPFDPEPAPGGLPGWTVAEAEGQGARRAWYSEPTDRYPYGAFGEPVNAGALVVEDAEGRRTTLQLRPDSVFEALSPFIADFDGNGQNDVLAVRSSLRAGASVVVYRLAGGTLIESAATPPLGRPGQWLNVAGIADFVGNGQPAIAIVKNPHADGSLEVLSFDRRLLRPVGRPLDGFVNHIPGAPEPGLSAVARVNRDSIADLVLPGGEARSLRMVTAAGGRLREIARVAIDGTVATAIGVLEGADTPVFVVGLADGSLVSIAEAGADD